ncbi:putative transcription factor [Gottschalkia purinilytica]|uniref:Putative transcription factor n=1 Tax=Gottschalkia purinilytica TaxID=1503 RepID=A0A0L0WAJ0_GOTPU|nr:helix-turn-helix domain-containing protein [Gottschalkia purinilytica]KNF08529.1 putative transcription factor [Gottschalkia purinilytica]
MCFATLVKEVREDLGLSQEDIALNIGVSQPMYSKYENCKAPIPDDIALEIAKKLKSPRLMAEYFFQNKSEFFNVPVLNNVDDNAIVVLDSLIEESTELIKYSQELKKILKNKKDRTELTVLDWETVMKCEEQIADIFPALKLHFIKMAEEFELDLSKLEKKIYQKLKYKKYVK